MTKLQGRGVDDKGKETTRGVFHRRSMRELRSCGRGLDQWRRSGSQ